MNEKLKYLTKAVAGYAGLNFTDANFAAYLEAFKTKTDEQFARALARAMLESPKFFPPLPQVMVSFRENEKDDARKQKQAEFNKKFSSLPYEDPEPRSAGWLIKLFQQKRAEFKKV